MIMTLVACLFLLLGWQAVVDFDGTRAVKVRASIPTDSQHPVWYVTLCPVALARYLPTSCRIARRFQIPLPRVLRGRIEIK
jgi:hypothetical protein